MKALVGVMLLSLGTFWTGEALGVEWWTGNAATLFAIAGAYAAVAGASLRSFCAACRVLAKARGNAPSTGKGPAMMKRHRRLTHPLVRDGDSLRKATWDEALDRAATALRSARERNGTSNVRNVQLLEGD